MSEFDKQSPLPLVSHWPDEEEKYGLIGHYFDFIKAECEEIEDRLIAPASVVAGGAKHHMRKRAEQAARTAKQMHQTSNRRKALEDRFVPRTLQDQTRTNVPNLQFKVFSEASKMPSIELFAKSRVGERGLESSRVFNDSAVRWITTRMAVTEKYEIVESKPETEYKIPSVYIDLERNLAFADVTSKTTLARYVPIVEDGPTVDLKMRHVGVLPIDPAHLTRREELHVGSLAFKKTGDLSAEGLEEPKETLRQLVMRDLSLPDEERLIEPSMMMLYVCRSGLGAARRTN